VSAAASRRKKHARKRNAIPFATTISRAADDDAL